MSRKDEGAILMNTIFGKETTQLMEQKLNEISPLAIKDKA